MSFAHTFTVVDVETTGGKVGVDRVIEIGAVQVKDGRVHRTFSTLVNPGRAIPWHITRLTGIDAGMVQGAPYFKKISDEFREFLGDTVFVAHNAMFDFSFLNAEFINAKYPPLETSLLCTLRMAKHVIPGLTHYNLGSLCHLLDIPLDRAHRAGDDCTATAELLLYMLSKLKFSDFNLDSFLRSAGPLSASNAVGRVQA